LLLLTGAVTETPASAGVAIASAAKRGNIVIGLRPLLNYCTR
jgi:hypothetical protein